MAKIPLTRCQFVLPFVYILDAVGAPVDSLLEKHNLPVDMEGHLDSYVPIRNALQFAETAKRAQGIADFGHMVARGANFHYLSARLRALIVNSPTLFVALKTLCANAHLEDTNLAMFLVFHGNSVRLHSQLIGVKGLRHLEHSQWLQNVLPVHVVREFAGPEWAPATMAFEAEYSPGAEVQEQWSRTRFLSGQPYSWIDVPVEYLSLPPISASLHHGPAETDGIDVSGKLVDSLKLMLPSYLGGKVPSVADIAEMANTSTRNLQRMLADSGFTYRGILNAVRFERAALLLRQPGIRIVDIALSLGYTDAAHFTRAFRTMAGVSPLQYRKSQLKSPGMMPGPFEDAGTGRASGQRDGVR
ncbi:helix-turn-helix transcriptional regulator [Bordetella petrii]|uniref:Helix-turn-helix transcriptional regulator n=1 Tax=Bordetella petrii TaxID=94624 RepID=A0ABT7W988_9BORD|nr:helix-turn-helix transcriptional regulator [Bordetella petrii]MDM9561766.1 helix-turn-helix transcriptional regulator [Bordetella petrii]